MEAFLADLVTGVHLAVVLFVVLLPPLVLAGAWRGEEREGGGCRVSLAARVEACRVVPARVVDYVAERALRRATKWL